MTLTNIGEQEMDRLCWCLVSTRNRFYPPRETAGDCIATLNIMDDDRAKGEEHGYHRGMFIARNMFMEQLYGYGINVLARANRYTYMKRKYGMELRTEDEPDYYRAARGGAEYTIHRWIDSGVMSPDEIESLDWPADYVPSGADVSDE